MTRIPILALDDAPEASQDPLKRQSERVGKTINIFGVMAHSPAVMGQYDAAEQVVVDADVVRTILANYFNHLVGTELDLQAAPELA